MSKKKEESKNSTPAIVPLEALILNFQNSRYPLVHLATRWAKVLRNKQENQYLKPNEILETALQDVLSDKVNAKTIEKGLQDLREARANPPEAATETKEKEKTKTKDKEEKETAGAKKKK